MKDYALKIACAFLAALFLLFLVLYVMGRTSYSASKAELTAQIESLRAENAEKSEALLAMENTLAGEKADADQQIDSLQAANREQADTIAKLNGQIAALTEDGSQKADQINVLENEAQTGSRIAETLAFKLKECLQEAANSYDNVSINEQGSVVIQTYAYFDSGKFDLKEYSYKELPPVANGLFNFLADPANAEMVDTVLFAGFTDDTGEAHANYILTARRAIAVMEQLMSANGGALRQFSDLFAAAGYGSAQPAEDNDSMEGRLANRRVEIIIVPRLADPVRP